SDRGDLGDRAPRSGDKKPGKSPERTRKPPIPKRGEARKEGGSSGRPPKGLAERSPYQRAKKPWGPHKPKRSS
ncbi:MAG: hypothetical protein KKB59_11010, partial [Spirochaetes bacterium]|nr:hypothetical protein [Spirochaetota bacterium]